MIVVLTGAHSCGKSTLLEFFRGKEGYVCIDSVTRSTITPEERKVDNGVSEEGQWRMYRAILEKTAEIRRMNHEDPSKVYLLDRSIFDFIAYNRAFEKRGWLNSLAAENIERGLKDLWENYDVVFYLPIEFKIVDDGVRSLDEDLRKDVDEEILNQILWNKVRTVKLNGSVRQRVESIYDTINILRFAEENPV